MPHSRVATKRMIPGCVYFLVPLESGQIEIHRTLTNDELLQAFLGEPLPPQPVPPPRPTPISISERVADLVELESTNAFERAGATCYDLCRRRVARVRDGFGLGTMYVTDRDALALCQWLCRMCISCSDVAVTAPLDGVVTVPDCDVAWLKRMHDQGSVGRQGRSVRLVPVDCLCEMLCGFCARRLTSCLC